MILSREGVSMEVESISGDLEIPLPVLDDIKNFHRWSVMMGLMFSFHEVIEIVHEGILDVEEKTSKEKDWLALTLIHRCVNSEILGKISAAKNANQAWDMLKNAYHGSGKESKEGGSIKGESSNKKSKDIKVKAESKPSGKSKQENKVKAEPKISVSTNWSHHVQEDQTETSIMEDQNSARPHAESRPEDDISPQQDQETVTEPSQEKDEAAEVIPVTEPCVVESLKEEEVLSRNDVFTASNQSSHQREEREPDCDGMVAAIDVSENIKVKPDLEEAMLAKVKQNSGAAIPCVTRGPWKLSNTGSWVSRTGKKRGCPWASRTEKRRGLECSKLGFCVSPEKKLSNLGIFRNLGFGTPKAAQNQQQPEAVEEKTMVREKLMLDRLVTRGYWYRKRSDVCVEASRTKMQEMAMKCVMVEKKLMVSVSDKKKKVEVLAALRRGRATERKKKQGRGATEREMKKACEKNSVRGRKLGHKLWVKDFDRVGLALMRMLIGQVDQRLQLMGLSKFLAQFDAHLGSRGRSTAEKHIIVSMGQSGVDVNQAQCLQKSKWVNVGLQTKQWDPGIIFVVPN